MKVFDSGSGWDTKVNFVDENNVFVGYDMAQDCCEHAGWFVSDSPSEPYTSGYDEPEIVEGARDHDLEPYSFDVQWKPRDVESKGLYDGGQVCFRLTADGKPDLYLHLFNSHNGYYGHGFESPMGEGML